MTWRRDNGSLSSYAVVKRGSLRIDHVVATDSGTYFCKAESQAGKSEASATLTVNCKVVNSFIFLVNDSGILLVCLLQLYLISRECLQIKRLGRERLFRFLVKLMGHLSL